MAIKSALPDPSSILRIGGHLQCRFYIQVDLDEQRVVTKMMMMLMMMLMEVDLDKQRVREDVERLTINQARVTFYNTNLFN